MKRYEITDWKSVVEVMKKYGVPASEVTKYINVETVVDEKKLEKLEAVGDISMKQLEGTYTVEELSSYLQMDEVKIES